MKNKKLPSLIQKLSEAIEAKGLKVQFGLVQQGHIPTIEKILSEESALSERTWQKIGKKIGWDYKTAAFYYIDYLRNILKTPPKKYTIIFTNNNKTAIEFDLLNFSKNYMQKNFGIPEGISVIIFNYYTPMSLSEFLLMSMMCPFTCSILSTNNKKVCPSNKSAISHEYIKGSHEKFRVDGNCKIKIYLDPLECFQMDIEIISKLSNLQID